MTSILAHIVSIKQTRGGTPYRFIGRTRDGRIEGEFLQKSGWHPCVHHMDGCWFHVTRNGVSKCRKSDMDLVVPKNA